MEMLHTQNYRKLMLGCQKGKMAVKPRKKGKEVLKRLVKQRKGKVSKTGRILSKNGRLVILAKNARFLTKTGGLESLAFLRG